MRLLVVEDDVKLVRALQRGLTREGYTVDVAAGGEEALSFTVSSHYDAVVLDLMLPGADGFEVCRTLRRRGEGVPVLILTARAEVRDRIRGLDSGADDYLVKPFDFGELLARLRALVRRGPSEPPAVLEVGELRLDSAGRSATHAGQPVDLTPREFAVLELLAMHAGEVVPRTQLLAEIWRDVEDVSPNVVDVYVGYLRRKLEQPSGPRVIQTVRGIGFLMEPG